MKLVVCTWNVRINKDTNNQTDKEERRGVNKEDAREG